MVAFGHPENVLSLCKAVSLNARIELVFVVSKERFRQGIMDIDISKMPYGLNSYHDSLRFLPREIKDFVGASFNIRFIRILSKSLLRRNGLKNLRLVVQAARQLRKESYYSVHYNGSSAFVGYFRMLLKGKRKTLWTIHDYIPHSGEGNRFFLVLRRLTMMLGFEYIQHYSWLRDRFIEYFKADPKKVHHVYSGTFDVYKQFDPLKCIEIKDYILFFGRISPYKGIDTLIDAYLKCKVKYPGFTAKLCIAGSGDLWFDDNLRDHPDIVFINRYMQTNELVFLVKNCRFVVLPYTDSTHSAVVMTAYAFCKPVVATDVGGLQEVILNEKTGYLVSKNDPGEMADVFIKLASDDGLIDQCRRNIIDFKLHGPINWDKISKQMKEIYEQ